MMLSTLYSWRLTRHDVLVRLEAAGCGQFGIFQQLAGTASKKAGYTGGACLHKAADPG